MKRITRIIRPIICMAVLLFAMTTAVMDCYDDNRTPILAVLKSSVWYRENGGCSVRGGRRFCCPNIFQMKGTYAYDRRAQEVPLMLRRRAAPGA